MSRDAASPRPVAVVTGAVAASAAPSRWSLRAPASIWRCRCSTPTEADAVSVRHAVEEKGAAVLLLKSNLAEVNSHPATAEAIAAHFGRLDVLVNNAGVSAVVRGDFLELTPENYDSVMDVNLKGTLFFTQACLRVMLRLWRQGCPPHCRHGVLGLRRDGLSRIGPNIASPKRACRWRCERSRCAWRLRELPYSKFGPASSAPP